MGVTAEAATLTPTPGVGALPADQFRLVCQPSDQCELAELRDRVRRILGDMARITDEPVKYLIHHQKLLQRGLSVPLRWASRAPGRGWGGGTAAQGAGSEGWSFSGEGRDEIDLPQGRLTRGTYIHRRGAGTTIYL